MCRVWRASNENINDYGSGHGHDRSSSKVNTFTNRFILIGCLVESRNVNTDSEERIHFFLVILCSARMVLGYTYCIQVQLRCSFYGRSQNQNRCLFKILPTALIDSVLSTVLHCLLLYLCAMSKWIENCGTLKCEESLHAMYLDCRCLVMPSIPKENAPNVLLTHKSIFVYWGWGTVIYRRSYEFRKTNLFLHISFGLILAATLSLPANWFTSCYHKCWVFSSFSQASIRM